MVVRDCLGLWFEALSLIPFPIFNPFYSRKLNFIWYFTVLARKPNIGSLTIYFYLCKMTQVSVLQQ